MLDWWRLKLLPWLYPASNPEDISWVCDICNNSAPEASLRVADDALKVDPGALNFFSMPSFCSITSSTKILVCFVTLFTPPRILSGSFPLTNSAAGFCRVLQDL
jgi:hypothetical protein